MKNATLLNKCLCCNSKNLSLILDLNEQPLANSFKQSKNEKELTFPLKLNLCESCSHLQLSHAVNPDLLFKNYLYVSGTSDTLKEYFKWFAKFSFKFLESPPKKVLDIACNDGTQLNSWKALGLETYGIDPAENLYKISSENHEIICDYFTDKYTKFFREKELDIINAQNVFAHNSYPLEFLKQCKKIMHKNTVLFIQTSQAEMIKNNEFDTIYHEHLSFFNANSMNTLAIKAGLYLTNIIKTAIHGTSYLFIFRLTNTQGNLKEVLQQEKIQGLQNIQTYATYAKKCYETIKALTETLKTLKDRGYVVCGYGAAAKGMTLINFAKMELDFIIDDNPLKQNLFSPGMNIPIVSINHLDNITDKKIVFIPLAWNFFKEIKAKIKIKRSKNDDIFVKYFPDVVIEGSL